MQECESWSLRKYLPFGRNTGAQQHAHPENDKYKHDLKQAELIRTGLTSKFSIGSITQNDVTLGLRGLDEADILRNRGDRASSRKVGERAIELLILFLKTPPSTLPEVDRAMVYERVQVALAKAERQREMDSKSESRAGNSRKSNSPDSIPRYSQDLANTLAGSVKKVKGMNANGGISGSSSVSPRALPSAQHQPYSPSNSTQNSLSSQTSQFYKSKDPMVQTIKAELYVPHSQLQEASWDEIAGLAEAKQSLQENAILPMIRPDLFNGLRRPRNILLYGPPGTGKTLLVKAVAKESSCLLFVCTASSLTSKWHGEGEKLLRTLFQVARDAAPSLIFIDEMDALLSSRKSDGEHEASRRFKTEFMTQMDGLVHGSASSVDGKHLLLIACTNCPWDIDPAVMRRFPRRLYIPLPDTKARKVLLTKLLESAGRHDLSPSDVKELSKRLHGFSGSDIAAIASDASFGPIRSLGGINLVRTASASDIRPITLHDFENAMTSASKSVTRKDLQRYEEWNKSMAA